MKRWSGAALALVLLAACSGGEEPAPSARPEDRPGATSAPDDRADDAAGKGKAGAGGGRGKDKDAGDGSTPAGKGGAGGDGKNVFNDTEEDDRSTAVYPAAGRYLYGQSGFERFCQAARCEDKPLPKTQPVQIALSEPSPDRAVVVSEIEASGNRTMRTTATYTRRSALVTEVYARFTYEGFSFENTYRPEPSVESLRFPLRMGATWSGRWKDSTSGEYWMDVIGIAEVKVGGATVNAFKLSSVTTFEGEFEGTAKALVWIDPTTKAMVKTTGRLDLRSAFGRYITEFSNVLRSGPGY